MLISNEKERIIKKIMLSVKFLTNWVDIIKNRIYKNNSIDKDQLGLLNPLPEFILNRLLIPQFWIKNKWRIKFPKELFE